MRSRAFVGSAAGVIAQSFGQPGVACRASCGGNFVGLRCFPDLQALLDGDRHERRFRISGSALDIGRSSAPCGYRTRSHAQGLSAGRRKRSGHPARSGAVGRGTPQEHAADAGECRFLSGHLARAGRCVHSKSDRAPRPLGARPMNASLRGTSGSHPPTCTDNAG